MGCPVVISKGSNQYFRKVVDPRPRSTSGRDFGCGSLNAFENFTN